MSFDAYFGDRLFTIDAFHITTTLTVAQGITGSLFVTLYATHTADPRPRDEHIGGNLDLSSESARGPDTLTIKDTRTNDQIEFHGIELTSVEDGVTRGERFRLLEFTYPRAMPKRPALRFSSKDDVPSGALGDAYKMSIDQQDRIYLLGARSLIEPGTAGYSVHRFWKLAYKNSFLNKVFEIDAEVQAKKLFPSFTIDYDRQQMKIDASTLRALVVEVAAGPPFANARMKPLRRILGQTKIDARYEPRERSAHDVWNAQKPEDYAIATGHRWLETATIAFNQGYYLTSGVL